jgi:4-diphosphocytidyl-2-C-methyl-D-erythritol kinase
VSGFGEIVEPLPYRSLVVTLVTPPIRCATADVFRAWDRLGGPHGPGVNDLELAALEVAPELVRWRDALGNDTGREPQLAGSGSTWFVFGAHPGPGRVVARTVPPSH